MLRLIRNTNILPAAAAAAGGFLFVCLLGLHISHQTHHVHLSHTFHCYDGKKMNINEKIMKIMKITEIMEKLTIGIRR